MKTLKKCICKIISILVNVYITEPFDKSDKQLLGEFRNQSKEIPLEPKYLDQHYELNYTANVLFT